MLRHPSTLFEGAKVLEGTVARDFLSLVFFVRQPHLDPRFKSTAVLNLTSGLRYSTFKAVAQKGFFQRRREIYRTDCIGLGLQSSYTQFLALPPFI
jgi:hypothetical protein